MVLKPTWPSILHQKLSKVKGTRRWRNSRLCFAILHAKTISTTCSSSKKITWRGENKGTQTKEFEDFLVTSQHGYSTSTSINIYQHAWTAIILCLQLIALCIAFAYETHNDDSVYKCLIFYTSWKSTVWSNNPSAHLWVDGWKFHPRSFWLVGEPGVQFHK